MRLPSTTSRRSSIFDSRRAKVRPGGWPNWMGVSAPSVTVALHRLERDGWVTIGEDRSVTLTSQGEELAASVVRVHRLLERWLTDMMGFDWAAADEEAQHLAPGVSDRLADRIDEMLGHPTTCPHGNIIPGRKPPYGKLIALADMPVGAGAHPTHFRGGRARRARPAAPTCATTA